MNELLYKAAKGELNFLDDSAIASNSEFAKQLQDRLQDFWLLKEPDGKWGQKSAAALGRFKALRGLEEKGISKLTASELINTNPKDLLRGYQLNGDDASLLTLYYSLKNWRIANNPGEINLCSLRGMNRDGSLNDDTPFRFNDRLKMFRFKKENGVFIPELAGNWLGTADPGRYYWDNPLNDNGCAWLVEGIPFKAWKIGDHKGQEALIQDAEIKVWRGPSKTIYTGDDFRVDIHSVYEGMDYSLGDDIGKWSAGCTVVASRSEFDNEVIPTIKTDPRYRNNNGYLWWYVAISGKNFRDWFSS